MSSAEKKMFYGFRYALSPEPEGDSQPPEVLPLDGSLLKGLLSKHKGLKPRFKIFHSEEEALEFAREDKDGIGRQEGSEAKAAPSGNAECPYPSLTPQELCAFKKDLQNSASQAISKKILENPRYLVSISTDTPSIIHSGTRSNALHVCAKVGDPHILSLILETLESTEFLESLYSKESEESRKQRGDHLLDNYINLPEKALNETPLHIASKYGNLSIIKILVSYSQCFISPLNKFGETPEAIACTRSPDGTSRRSVIAEAIKGRVYIPVYRSLEYGGSIGEPWSPATPSKRLFDTRDFSPVKSPYRSPHRKSPLVVLPSVDREHYSLCNGPRRVSGLLGPVSPAEAPKLKKEWKHSGSRSRLKDPSRGFEKQGREIAKKYGIDWREYWEFLDAYVDFSSPEGLVALNDYLSDMQHRSNEDSYALENLSYGLEEMELKGVATNVEEEEIKSPISLLSQEFQGLSLSSPSTPFRNPLLTHFNRNIKREKQSFYLEVNGELANISEQVLTSYLDYEDDREDIHHLLMSTFSLPLSVFKRAIHRWRVDGRPFYCEEDTLLQNLSAKVTELFHQEVPSEELSDFIRSLKEFPSLKPAAIALALKDLNDSYRSDTSFEEDERPKAHYDTHFNDVLPFVSMVYEGLTNTNETKCAAYRLRDMNANSHFMCLTGEDKALRQTKDIFQNLSLEEEEESDSEESYRTAESSRDSFETALTDDEAEFESNKDDIFIYGRDPSQTDLEVYLALDGVDTSDYPHISAWKACVEEYDLVSRSAWPSKTRNLEESLNISRFDLDVSLDQ